MSALIWAIIALIVIAVLYFVMTKMMGGKKGGTKVPPQNPTE